MESIDIIESLNHVAFRDASSRKLYWFALPWEVVARNKQTAQEIQFSWVNHSWLQVRMVLDICVLASYRVPIHRNLHLG
jgi:hypothetical protein